MPTPQLPAGPSAPRAWQTARWILRPLAFVEDCRRRYGDMFTVRIAQEGDWVMLSDPAHVKQVFSGDPRIFHAGEGNAILEPLVGSRSVLLLDEASHMRERKLLLGPFHGEHVQRYGELMTDVANAEIARWPRGEPLELWPRMQAVTLELIMRAVFGIDEGRRLTEMRDALNGLLAHTMAPTTGVLLALLGPARFGRLPTVRRQLRPSDDLLFAQIAARRAEGGLEERDDILSMLLLSRHEDGSPMEDRELRDELMTLLVAGHETTATALGWAVERLVRHPAALERLRDEVLEQGPGGEYLDAVARETLRLRPVLPLVVRRLTEPVEIGGRLLPAGAAVTPCIHLIHRRPDVYPDPHAFRPERFLEQPAGTYTWIPFGGGVRRCLGATFALFEMKQVLAALVGSLDLRAVTPGSERIGRRAITLTPSGGTRVVVADRAPAAAPVAA